MKLRTPIIGFVVGFVLFWVTSLVREEAPQAVQAARPAVTMVVLDRALEPYALAWREEIARRFPNALGLLVHGGDFVEGQWILGASLAPNHVSLTTEVVRRYQSLYPGRTIVLLACNPGHLRLGIPGVYYAPASVWCIPDRAMTPDAAAGREQFARLGMEDWEQAEGRTRWELYPDVIGNIFEFSAE